MESSLTLSNLSALFLAMFIGAAIPSLSVLTVTARTVAFGFSHGVFTTLGIVLGDVIFILIAILGLSLLAETMGDLFIVVKYLGGAYLIWLGITIWRSETRTAGNSDFQDSSLYTSFSTGLLITLSDQKAILFYLGFFPAFIDLSTISLIDTSIIIVIAIFAVGGAKLAYTYLVSQSRLLFRSKAIRWINILAGSVMIAIGLILITHT